MYKIVKLLTITRNYSSRIWNEIRQQLLKSDEEQASIVAPSTDEVEKQMAACEALDKFEVPKALYFTSEILRNNGKYLRAKTVGILKIT